MSADQEPGFEWTSEREAVLRTLWAQGLSASEIHKQLPGSTRNAVIGKARRLGLARRPSPIQNKRKGIMVLDLRVGLCHWPLGDPRAKDFHYCGAPTEGRQTYCEEHRCRSSAGKPKERIAPPKDFSLKRLA